MRARAWRGRRGVFGEQGINATTGGRIGMSARGKNDSLMIAGSQNRTFKYGDSVIHTGRPEWGTGVVVRAEATMHEGQASQRLQIRFTHSGLKILDTAVATVVPADAVVPAAKAAEGGPQGWIATLEKKRPEDFMTAMPESARDPFRTVWQRLESAIELYRFTREPKSMTQWAIAQSGMNDPLSRFSRQELELLFDRWCRNRDLHLVEVYQEAERADAAQARKMMHGARPGARDAALRGGFRR